MIHWRMDNVVTEIYSSPRAFPIICGRPTGFEYNASTLSCPVYIILYSNPTLFQIYSTRVFPSVFLSSSSSLSWYCATNIHLSMCPSSNFYMALSLHMIFFVTGATFTYLLTCSFLILPFFVTPHIHRSILISSTYTSLFLAFRCWTCLLHGLTALFYFPVLLHGHLSGTKHSTVLLPISPCCTHPMSYLHIHIPPFSSTTAPGEKLFTFCNSSTDSFTVCRFTLSACSNPHSIQYVLHGLLTPIPFQRLYQWFCRHSVTPTSLPPHRTTSSPNIIDSGRYCVHRCFVVIILATTLARTHIKYKTRAAPNLTPTYAYATTMRFIVKTFKWISLSTINVLECTQRFKHTRANKNVLNVCYILCPIIIYKIQKHIHGAPQPYSRYTFFETILSHKCTIKAHGTKHGMHAKCRALIHISLNCGLNTVD